MGPLDLALHFANFAAPALALALVLPSMTRLLSPRRPAALSWWSSVALHLIAGLAVLMAGLWLFGVDGKIATYAALVAVAATLQWFLTRGWAR